MESKVDVDLSKSSEEDKRGEFVVSLVIVTVKKTSTVSSGFSRSQQTVDISLGRFSLGDFHSFGITGLSMSALNIFKTLISRACGRLDEIEKDASRDSVNIDQYLFSRFEVYLVSTAR